MGGWVGDRKVEEKEAVGTSCWTLWAGWVGGWVGGRRRTFPKKVWEGGLGGGLMTISPLRGRPLPRLGRGGWERVEGQVV